jgi:RimJ/RimL family protein N-acetyltransferase
MQESRQYRLTSYTTERLHLRGLLPEDEEFIVRLYADPEVSRHIQHGPMPEAKARRWFNDELEWAKYSPHFGHWIVLLRDSQVPIGLVHLGKYRERKFDDDPSDDIQLDYQFLPEYWGRGYASEAAQIMLSYIFDVRQRRRLVVYTRPENDRSIKFLQRLGFQKAGACRDDTGHTCDLFVLYSAAGCTGLVGEQIANHCGML